MSDPVTEPASRPERARRVARGVRRAALRSGRWFAALDDDARSVLLAALVGVATAVVAILFETGIELLASTWSDPARPPLPWWGILAIPAVGGLAVGLLRRSLDSAGEGFGVGHVVEALATGDGRIPRRRSMLAALGAMITLGSGGSAGPEGPIVQVGAGVGGEVGSRFPGPSQQRRMLLGCGSAAGIATLFNAPIGGVLFVVEVITEGFGVLSIGPVLIAAVTATAVRHMILGASAPFGDLTGIFDAQMPWYAYLAFLGLVCLLGAGSGYLGRSLLAWWQRGHVLAKRLPGPVWLRPAFGGLVVGLCALGAPEVRGIGYETIGDLLRHPKDMALVGLVTLLALKVVATGATLTTGGAGGVFAPSLFLGAGVGVVAGSVLVTLGVPLQEEVLAILCMAALMSSLLHCPMTATLLVFELTRNYSLILPTMAAAVLATWISKRTQEHSIFLLELTERGVNYRRGTDLSVLRHINMVDILETDAVSLREDDDFERVREAVRTSRRNYFPVLDDSERLCGMIFLEDLRTHMFDRDLESLLYARDLMHTDIVTVQLDERMDDVMTKFDSTGAWSLPVVFLGRFRGMVSRSRIQVAYRNTLIVETRG